MRETLLICAVAIVGASTAHADVAIQVNGAVTHQTIEGYGATTESLVFGAADNLPPALRTQAIEAAYGEVKLNMGNLEVGPFESPSGQLYSPANDDSDPANINPAGFDWTQSDNMKQKLVDPAQPYGFDAFYLGPAISETYAFAWAKSLRGSDYQAYLAECAEHVAALAIHWREAYGITPRLMQLWNEPLSGNTEMSGGSAQELTDIVKAAGARLRAEGFADMKFVVPADETEQRSLDEATAILSDTDAAQYVGAVAYHPYPYGSTYASVPNILATSGAGQPDASKVLVRNQLRDLAAEHGIPTFMVEVSHSDVPFGDFDGLRGRAIQIHDEMVYADAAAFFGMNALWDWNTQTQHYQGRADPGLFSETDSIVLIDDAPDAGAQQVFITEMGRAIGHYARWAPRGSVRLEAQSDDPLVQVTAFRDDADGRLSLVLINNAQVARTLQVSVQNLALAGGAMQGEQSVAGAYWQSLSPGAATATGFSVALPALSVTSLGAGLAAGATSASSGSGSGSGGSSSTTSAGATTGSSGTTSGSSTGGSAAGSGTGASGGAGTSGAAASSGGSGSTGAVDGGCSSTGGLALLAPALLILALRRRSSAV